MQVSHLHRPGPQFIIVDLAPAVKEYWKSIGRSSDVSICPTEAIIHGIDYIRDIDDVDEGLAFLEGEIAANVNDADADDCAYLAEATRGINKALSEKLAEMRAYDDTGLMYYSFADWLDEGILLLQKGIPDGCN